MPEYTLKDSKGLAKIERMALRQRWDADPDKLNQAYQRQIDIASNPKTPNRESTSAFRAITAAVGQNQKDEHKILDVKSGSRSDELDAIALELGIDPALIIDASEPSNPNTEIAHNPQRGRNVFSRQTRNAKPENSED